MSAPLSFITRRPPRQSSAPAVTGAKLSLNAAVIKPPVEEKEKSTKRNRIGNGFVLDNDHRMVTLTKLQSATGSLKIKFENAGGLADALWELQDGTQGDQKNIPLDAGKRPIFSVNGNFDEVIIGLRHVRALRRLAFYTYPGVKVSIETFDGQILTCGDNLRLLSIYQLNGELYLRYSGSQFASREALTSTLAFNKV